MGYSLQTVRAGHIANSVRRARDPPPDSSLKGIPVFSRPHPAATEGSCSEDRQYLTRAVVPVGFHVRLPRQLSSVMSRGCPVVSKRSEYSFRMDLSDLLIIM